MLAPARRGLVSRAHPIILFSVKGLNRLVRGRFLARNAGQTEFGVCSSKPPIIATRPGIAMPDTAVMTAAWLMVIIG